jgi:tRNA nucleotidyltransferase/poly(A) polymerase
MLRLARFASKLDFKIDKDTEKATKKLSHNITKISPERIRDELLKSASQSGEKFAQYILKLDNLKLLKHILPEVVNLKWYRENLQNHPETRGEGGTVFAHVMAALKKSDTKDPIKNLAILLHDVGKGISFTQENGLPRYFNHAKKSIDLVNTIAARLKMSNTEKDALIFAVGNHMKFHKILDMKPSKIAEIVNNDHWDVLVAVGRADEFARGHMFKHKGEFEKIIDKAIKVKEKYGANQVNKQVKLVNGKDVMKLTNLSPGPMVGKIITDVTAWAMDNNIEDKQKIEDKIKELHRDYTK